MVLSLALAAFVVCWAALAKVACATVVFHNGVLTNVTLYSPPFSSFVGPQPSDNIDPITRTVVVYNDNPCDANGASRATLSDRIVLMTAVSAPCSSEATLLYLQSLGAAGILLLNKVPSMAMYLQDGSFGAHTRSSRTFFLQVELTTQQYQAIISMAPNLNATIFPDANVWGATFSSWYYQLFIRILPSTILISSGLFAVVFLVQHALIRNDRFNMDTVASRRTFRRRLLFFVSTADLPVVALAIEMVTATLPGVILAIDGFQSNAALPYTVVGFFSTLLNGWSMVCSLVSAKMWAKRLSDITPGREPSLITRIIQGDYWLISVFLYLSPVIIDVLFNVCIALGYDVPIILAGGPAVEVLIQIAISSSLIAGAVRYYRTVNGIQQNAGAAIQHDTSVECLMKRLCRCALGLAIAMVVSCSGIILLGLAPATAYTPNGFTVATALFYNGRAMDSAFRVVMFKPRERDNAPSENPSEGPGIMVPVQPRTTTAAVAKD